MADIKKVMAAAEANNMQVFYAEKKEDVNDIVKSILKEGDKVAVGGSVSLKECGVLDLLRCGKYEFLDRYKEGLNQDDIKQIYIDSFSSDVYFSSVNAITEKGELYNVDGTGNRVAALLYGPESVILVVGKNKIVKDIDEAVLRVKKIAAPMNTKRLSFDTYCKNTGECLGVFENDSNICSGCKSEMRICADYVIMAHQRVKNRIKIIFVNEDLGY